MNESGTKKSSTKNKAIPLVGMARKLSGEKLFGPFFGLTPEYCYVLSDSGQILDVNRSALRGLGYKKNMLVGQPVTFIFAEEAPNRLASF